MENKAVSMEQIQQMLDASQRLNKMKQEIDATIRMALGFLTEAEVLRFRSGEKICGFVTPGLTWEIFHLKRGVVDVEVYDARSSTHLPWYIYRSIMGADNMQMRYVRLVHEALPEVLTNLVEVFPALTERFALLLRVAFK